MVRLDQADQVFVHDTQKPATRTNRAEDPSARTDRWQTARWFGSGGAGTYTFVTGAADGPAGTNSYRRKIWTVGGGVGDTGFQVRRAADLSAAGNFWYDDFPPGMPISVWMRHTSATQKRFRIRTQVYSTSGGNLGTVDIAGSATSDVPPNVWFRMEGVLPARPADAARFLLLFDTNGGATWAAGETLDVGAMMLGDSGPYYDGRTPRPGYTVAWAGAADESASVATRVAQRVEAAYLGSQRIALWEA